MDKKKVAHSPKEAAERTGLSLWAVYKGIRSGDIPSVRVGRRELVPDWWIKRFTDAPEAA